MRKTNHNSKHRTSKEVNKSYNRNSNIILAISILCVCYIWSMVLWPNQFRPGYTAKTLSSAKPLAIKLISSPTNPLEGGEPMAISGIGFTTDKPMEVMIGGQPAKDVKVVNANIIAATAPAGSDGTAIVEVTRADGAKASLSGSLTYSKHMPRLSTFSPESGPASGGTEVKITGNNFEPGIEVWFGNEMSANVKLINDHELIAITPAQEKSGEVDILLVNQNGEKSNEFDFDFE